MKKFKEILLRDKIDLGMLIVTIAAFIQHFIISKNITLAFGVIAVYIFFAMFRLHRYNMVIRKQDKDILKLNLEIFRLNDELTEWINLDPQKRMTFTEKVEELKKKKNLENHEKKKEVDEGQ